MNYEISSVTNRDQLLLHHYRLLRQPVDGFPEILKFESGYEVVFQPSGSVFRCVGEYPLMDTANYVPMVCFSANTANLDILADLQELVIEDNSIYMTSSRTDASTILGTLYWIPRIEYLLSRIERLEEALRGDSDAI